MVSGIDSLATTHEQVFVGWTGDIESAATAKTSNADGSSDSATTKIPSSSISEEDRTNLEGLLDEYRARDEPTDGKDIHYVPVWLDDKDAHGHYDGYCKQSESARPMLKSRVCYLSPRALALSPFALRLRVPAPSRLSRCFCEGVHLPYLHIWLSDAPLCPYRSLVFRVLDSSRRGS